MFLYFNKFSKLLFKHKIKLNIKDTLHKYQNYSEKILFNMEDDFKLKLKQLGNYINNNI